MRSALLITLLFVVLSVLAVSCSEAEPEPACIGAEVMGEDCETGWYILKLDEVTSARVGGARYTGQLQGGFVTTDNLPAVYRQTGAKVQVALELNGRCSPRCGINDIRYPAVKVINVCAGATKNS